MVGIKKSIQERLKQIKSSVSQLSHRTRDERKHKKKGSNETSGSAESETTTGGVLCKGKKKPTQQPQQQLQQPGELPGAKEKQDKQAAAATAQIPPAGPSNQPKPVAEPNNGVKPADNHTEITQASPVITTPKNPPKATDPNNKAHAPSCSESSDNETKDPSEGACAITAKSIKDAGPHGNFANLMADLEQKGWAKVAEEFKIGYRTNAEVNNQSRYVIHFNVPPDGDFIDANNVEIPGMAITDPRFCLVSAPDPTSTYSQETFWRMIYDSCPSVVVFVENYEAEWKDSPFLPWLTGEARDYGKMTVNNKKTTTDGTMTAYLEVLPDGCSNSIITRFVQPFKWPDTVLADSDGSARSSALQMVRSLREEKGMIVLACCNGCGKSAMLLMMIVILLKLNVPKTKLAIPDLLRVVRSERWGAIQTVDQYLAIHSLLLDHVRTKYPRLSAQSTTLKKSLQAFVEKTKKK